MFIYDTLTCTHIIRYPSIWTEAIRLNSLALAENYKMLLRTNLECSPHPKQPSKEEENWVLPLLAALLLLLLSHFSRVWLCVTPSLGFSRQEHWSELPFPSPVHESEKWKWSFSVVSDSSLPHGLQPTRLLHPWDFPGKSTGVECYCLLHLAPLNHGKRIHIVINRINILFPFLPSSFKVIIDKAK